MFGYEYSQKNYDEYKDEPLDDDSINTDNDEFNNYEYPTTSPEEPPPVKVHQDIETIVELTPNEALSGASILIVVVVAIDTVTQIQTRLMSSQYEQLIKKTKFGR